MPITPSTNWIAKNRLKLGISREELAKKMGVSLTTIKRWELEQTEPKMSQVETLKKILRSRRKA